MTVNKKIIIIAVVIAIFAGVGYLVYQSNTIPEGGAEKEIACIDSGGTVTTGWCWRLGGNFPNTCLIGACDCPPGFLNHLLYGRKVKFCRCGQNKCFDGEKCILFSERSADGAVIAFMNARIQRDQESALSWLTDNAEGQYLSRSDRPLTGLSNPHFADFGIFEREELNDNKVRIRVRIFEEYTGQGEVGYFDETLTVIKKEDKYLIDSVELGQYRMQDSITVKQSGGAAMLIAECGDKNYITNEADYIIEGTVKRVDSKWDEEKTSIFTYTDLSIEKYVKGIPFEENELQIITPGGTVGETSQMVEDQPIFHEGKKVRIYFRETNGEFSIICAQFGVEEI